MVFGILLFFFIIVCVFLCLIILIQSDKGGGISGAVGGGLSGANNFLGTQDTANVLTKGTYIFGAVFLLLCVLMTFFIGGRSGVGGASALQKRAESQAITATPATPISGFGEEASEEAAAGVMQMLEGGESEEASPETPAE